MIHSHEGQFKVQTMCRAMRVSPNGYYDWSGSEPSARERGRTALDISVAAAFEAEKGHACSPRLHLRLTAQGHRAGRHQVAQSLRRQGLRAKGVLKYKPTTDFKHSLPVAPNLLQQDFSAERPNQKWVSDFTYLATDKGWLYLAVVIYIRSR